MLKFFFDRFSKVVYTLEILGVIFTMGWYAQWNQMAPSPFTKILFFIYVFEYLFIRFCATKRWHKNAKRYEGIELHFKKAMIPTSYILAIVSGVGFWTGSSVQLWVAILLLGILLHVNVILLYLHYKDKNKTPINYYSHSKHLR